MFLAEVVFAVLATSAGADATTKTTDTAATPASAPAPPTSTAQGGGSVGQAAEQKTPPLTGAATGTSARAQRAYKVDHDEKSGTVTWRGYPKAGTPSEYTSNGDTISAAMKSTLTDASGKVVTDVDLIDLASCTVTTAGPIEGIIQGASFQEFIISATQTAANCLLFLNDVAQSRSGAAGTMPVEGGSATVVLKACSAPGPSGQPPKEVTLRQDCVRMENIPTSLTGHTATIPVAGQLTVTVDFGKVVATPGIEGTFACSGGAAGGEPPKPNAATDCNIKVPLTLSNTFHVNPNKLPLLNGVTCAPDPPPTTSPPSSASCGTTFGLKNAPRFSLDSAQWNLEMSQDDEHPKPAAVPTVAGVATLTWAKGVVASVNVKAPAAGTIELTSAQVADALYVECGNGSVLNYTSPRECLHSWTADTVQNNATCAINESDLTNGHCAIKVSIQQVMRRFGACLDTPDGDCDRARENGIPLQKVAPKDSPLRYLKPLSFVVDLVGADSAKKGSTVLHVTDWSVGASKSLALPSDMDKVVAPYRVTAHEPDKDPVFDARLRPRGLFGWKPTLGMLLPGLTRTRLRQALSPIGGRVYFTFPVSVVSLKLPAPPRELRTSADPSQFQVSTLQTGIMAGWEPWDYDQAVNPVPIPVRLLAGLNFTEFTTTPRINFSPSLMAGFAVTAPVLKFGEGTAFGATNTGVGVYLETNLRELSLYWRGTDFNDNAPSRITLLPGQKTYDVLAATRLVLTFSVNVGTVFGASGSG